MNAEKALLAALAADPLDPVARAAYADWLEESGVLESRAPSANLFGRGWLWWYGGLGPLDLPADPSVLPGLLFTQLRDSEGVEPGALIYATREAAVTALRSAVESLRMLRGYGRTAPA